MCVRCLQDGEGFAGNAKLGIRMVFVIQSKICKWPEAKSQIQTLPERYLKARPRFCRLSTSLHGKGNAICAQGRSEVFDLGFAGQERGKNVQIPTAAPQEGCWEALSF